MEKFLLKILPISIFLFFFLFYSFLIFQIPKDILYGDETIFWDQAQKISQGKFVNFENTQPLFFPLVLSLFLKDLFLVRFLNSFLILASGLILFFIVRKNFNNFFASIALFLFLSYLFSIHSAITLYTEAWFTFFLLLIFLFFEKFKKGENNLFLIFYGILLGLLLQSRVTGIWVLVFLFFYLFFQKTLKKTHFISFFTALFIFLPYFFLGGLKFLQEKGNLFSITSLENLLTFFLSQIFNSFYYLFPILPFFLIGVISYFKTKEINPTIKFHFSFILFGLVLGLMITVQFSRYFYLIFPSIIILSIFGLKESFIFLKTKFNKVFVFFLIFLSLSLFFFFSVRVEQLYSPQKFYQQRYFLKIPSFCQEIKNFYLVKNIKPKPGEEILEIKLAEKKEKIELPFLNQPSFSLYLYFNEIKINKNYNFLVLSYLDDNSILFLNQKEIGSTFDPWRGHIFEIKIEKEKNYLLSLLIYNSINIGGIGQVLLCQEKPF